MSPQVTRQEADLRVRKPEEITLEALTLVARVDRLILHVQGQLSPRGGVQAEARVQVQMVKMQIAEITIAPVTEAQEKLL
jgi:hypothetical protein